MSKNIKELDRALATNHNLQLVDELKTVQPGQTTLTEAQKQAFQALMRLAHDPRGFQWKKRVEKMNARQEKEMGRVRPRTPERAVMVPAKPERPRLRVRIREMRRNGTFPLRAQVPSERTRRYGFIPASQRQRDVKDYAKV